MITLNKTNFKLPGQTAYYKGKVRDVYTIAGNILVMIASDRISAFDVVLPRGIPYKGQRSNSKTTRCPGITTTCSSRWSTA